MPVPPRDYFRLEDLLERWVMDERRLHHYIETGKLSCCVSLRKSWINFGTLRKKKSGEELFVQEEKFCVKGLVGLLPEDCEWVFRDGKTQVSLFYSLKSPGHYLQLIGDNSGRSVERKDIVILRDELMRFEKENALLADPKQLVVDLTQSVIPISHAVTKKDDFTHSPDYRIVVFDGETHRFGEIQAKIVKQLHEASKTDDIWLNGKEAVHEAGGASVYMRDAFRRHKSWRKIIKSDGKGRYRLVF